MAESNVKNQQRKSESIGVSDNVTGKKIKFSNYFSPEVMELVNRLYQQDNCRTKSEFVQKAVRFYCGYLLTQENAATEYLAPQIASVTEGILSGTEHRLSRAMFKIAVELGAVTHLLAAVNDVDDETLYKLRAMCTDEVKRINGTISFESAVRYQRSDA